MSALYLDSSALVKLVEKEAESTALRRYLRAHRARRVTSALARVEVVRAVLGGGADAVAKARRQLSRVHTVTLDGRILDRAATLAAPVPLRGLDAIHLATAQALGRELQVVLTYDTRMAGAANALGFPTAAPV